YMDWNAYSFLKLLRTHFLFVLRVMLSEMWKAKRIIPIKKNLASLLLNIFKADAVYGHLKNKGFSKQELAQMPFYAFWFYDTSYLGVLRQKYGIRKTIARAHSGDLYEDHASRVKRADLRHFQLSTLSALLPVSAQGAAYMKKTYPAYKNQIHTVYLGTRDGGINEYKAAPLTIVSCARFNFHKRLDKIAQALLQTKATVTWIHIGDERLGQDIPGMPAYLELKKQLSSRPNIELHPTGAIDNAEIFHFYQRQPVNLFISLSEHEGIPVSIMEAISFGIPVLATNAGGCREIVNEHTGMLLPVDITAEAVAEILDGFAESPMNNPEFRNGVRQFWEQHFSEEHNYEVLMKYINIK
ncbi:MAG: glycosyltransferase, partial [Bacteroidetes bacterium]|nr:glycosyltransferase [Bacteroidota bacterium]